jgi:hypothetical protein
MRLEFQIGTLLRGLADHTAAVGGSGGKGAPSATRICIAPFVVVFRLTDELGRTTMEPASTVRPESRATFLKRIVNTSRCHPLRYLAKAIFGVQNVPIAEHWVVKNG